jgi:hypothetical protein
MFAGVPPEHVQAFGNDRKAFRGNAPRMPLPEASGTLMVYLRRLEAMLRDGRPYLLGAVPTIADFSAYHSVWFVRRTGALGAELLAPHRRLQVWEAHVKNIGHGQGTALGSADAVTIARDATPAALSSDATCDAQGIALGDEVRIAPSDYGIDPVEGKLVMCALNELAIQRSDPRAGEVVVHFPRVGFQMERAGR